ncbi:hypothetical protein CSKR_100238 [Clonorchis sinensis]|uniref:Uncharacterized protein n=1 Tax=Clonorchis sinensis TaxID=79923 RepID=A0A419PDT0_CLOSI|nr:hypothetical protein CSKR_100238 [Clonorchis sinensis]
MAVRSPAAVYNPPTEFSIVYWGSNLLDCVESRAFSPFTESKHIRLYLLTKHTHTHKPYQSMKLSHDNHKLISKVHLENIMSRKHICKEQHAAHLFAPKTLFILRWFLSQLDANAVIKAISSSVPVMENRDSIGVDDPVGSVIDSIFGGPSTAVI